MKNEMTMEDLEKEYKKTTEHLDNLAKVINERKRVEEENRKAELAAEREKREKEIADLMSKLEKLLVAYNRDYGAYRTNRTGIFGSLWPFYI